MIADQLNSFSIRWHRWLMPYANHQFGYQPFILMSNWWLFNCPKCLEYLFHYWLMVILFQKSSCNGRLVDLALFFSWFNQPPDWSRRCLPFSHPALRSVPLSRHGSSRAAALKSKGLEVRCQQHCTLTIFDHWLVV